MQTPWFSWINHWQLLYKLQQLSAFRGLNTAGGPTCLQASYGFVFYLCGKQKLAGVTTSTCSSLAKSNERKVWEHWFSNHYTNTQDPSARECWIFTRLWLGHFAAYHKICINILAFRTWVGKIPRPVLFKLLSSIACWPVSVVLIWLIKQLVGLFVDLLVQLNCREL